MAGYSIVRNFANEYRGNTIATVTDSCKFTKHNFILEDIVQSPGLLLVLAEAWAFPVLQVKKGTDPRVDFPRIYSNQTSLALAFLFPFLFPFVLDSFNTNRLSLPIILVIYRRRETNNVVILAGHLRKGVVLRFPSLAPELSWSQRLHSFSRGPRMLERWIQHQY